MEYSKVQGMKTWKELTTGVQQLVRLLFNNNFIDPALVNNSGRISQQAIYQKIFQITAIFEHPFQFLWGY